MRKLFVKISQNEQENTCVGVSSLKARVFSSECSELSHFYYVFIFDNFENVYFVISLSFQ